MKRPVIIAVLMGVVASLFAAMYLSSIETKYKKGAQNVTVLVAKDYIDQGSMIEKELVEVQSVPKSFMQPRALKSIEELHNDDGKAVFMSIVPIEKGEQVMTTKLSMLGIDTGISAVIPTGKRAITHVFNGSTVAGIIKPGNKVDIIGVFSFIGKEGTNEEVSKTILQNILVLSVGKDVIGSVKKAAGKNKSGEFGGDPGDGRVPVSFALTPQEADILMLAAEKGTVSLSLRSMGDDAIIDAGETKLNDISDKITASKAKTAGAGTQVSDEYMKELQKRQKEALEMLKKYQKR